MSSSDPANEYVNGTNVKWLKIARSWVGGLFNAYFLGIITLIAAISEGARTALFGFTGWLGNLIAGLLGIVSVDPAEFTAVTMVVLQDLGPLAWPLAILIVGVALLAGLEVISGG